MAKSARARGGDQFQVIVDAVRFEGEPGAGFVGEAVGDEEGVGRDVGGGAHPEGRLQLGPAQGRVEPFQVL